MSEAEWENLKRAAKRIGYNFHNKRSNLNLIKVAKRPTYNVIGAEKC